MGEVVGGEAGDSGAAVWGLGLAGGAEELHGFAGRGVGWDGDA